MSNGNSPAYPHVEMNYVQGVLEPVDFHEGLTKREMFAMNAPDGIPSWFQQEHARAGENESAVYFKWCKYYADELLKELSPI